MAVRMRRFRLQKTTRQRAVASELFFECPRKLYKLEPTLFEALVEIYGSDPRSFTDR